MNKTESDARWVATLLDDERVKSARESMRIDLHKEWENAESLEEREECWRLLQVERRFWMKLEKYLRDFAVLRSK